jgi:2-dehydropantoate 2-reductase
MRLCIFGAGAIGGLLGARLAQAGEVEVTLIARGGHLAAMRERGLRLLAEGEDVTLTPRTAGDAIEAGEQDYVIITLKASAVADAVEAMQPLLGPKTAVVMAVNGLPWWYFYGVPGPWRDHRLASLDPEDKQWKGIGPERVIACVVYPAAEVVSHGVVRHVSGDRMSLGEPDGSRSPRVEALSQALIRAGFKAPVKTDIRTEIWVKLWGNVAFNPISALTGGTLAQICTDPTTRALVRRVMTEAEVVAAKLGVTMPIGVERRVDGAAAVGDHKTSMLQDFERGRRIELDAIVGAVAELGRLVDLPTPAIDTLFALTRQRAMLLGLYP